AATATQNAVLLDVVDRYLALSAAEQRRDAMQKTKQEVDEIVRLTASFAKAGQGRAGDADRARADALVFQAEAERIEEEIAIASADLAELLGADPSIRLRANDAKSRAISLIPDDTELAGLVRTAMANRPEVGAAAAAVAESQSQLRQARLRPLLPLISIGFSAGSFGGGSNLVGYRFDHFAGRADFDAVAVWSLQNEGVGTAAIARERRAALAMATAE